MAAQVMDTSERAFMTGLSVVGHTSVAIVLGVAVIIFPFLRDASEVSEADRR